MERLFFAFKPDVLTAQRIASAAGSLKARLALNGKLLAPERLHITLHQLGDFPRLPHDLIAVASQVAGEVATLAAVHAFELSVDRAMSFRRNVGASPFAAPVGCGREPLMQFWVMLGEALWRSGLLARPRQPSQFTPHVTLMYGDAAAGVQPIAPITWRGGEFFLVHSLLGRTTHISLARWRFQG